jgi:hypothetical protein
MPSHCEPPSVVRTIDVHTGLEQGADPRSQNSLAETAVKETGLKPAGTGPPAGGPFGTEVVVVAAAVVVVEEAEVPVVEGLPLAVVDVVAALEVAEVAGGEGAVVEEAPRPVVVVPELCACLLPPPQPAASRATEARATGTAREDFLTGLLTLGRPGGFRPGRQAPSGPGPPGGEMVRGGQGCTIPSCAPRAPLTSHYANAQNLRKYQAQYV